MKVIISNPTIAPHVKQNVRAYHEKGCLQNFYCAFVFHKESKLAIFLSKISIIKRVLNRRSFNEIPLHFFKTRPFPELLRSLSSRKLTTKLTDQTWEWAELSFDRWVGRNFIKNKPDIVHTYEHAALATLKAAKANNIFTVYEQVSQHHSFLTPIIKKQFQLYPTLKSFSSDLLINEKASYRNIRRDAELELTDMIICNSSFTKNTLIEAGVFDKKIKVIPLAFPETLKTNELKIQNKCIKFLYAGNQSIRKGTHLLYEAWRQCNFKNNEAELLLIGTVDKELLLGNKLPDNVVIIENIPHEQLMKLYQEVDVFVLPTLADGFGMVITEAMSQGIPVITTVNSCGPDLISHGINGWVIPAGDINELANAMINVFKHKEKLPEMSRKAIEKAESWQWSDYRKALFALIEESWQNR